FGGRAISEWRSSNSNVCPPFAASGLTPAFPLVLYSALARQLEQMRVQRTPSDGMDLLRDVVVDERQELVQCSGIPLRKGIKYFFFTLQPMRDQAAHFVMRPLDEIAMSWSNRRDVEGEQPLE